MAARWRPTDRLLAVWRRVLSLSWPVMVEQVFRTLMRTTDIIIAGLFSPAAVAAIGLADLYARFPLRIGLSFGAGAIALSSQDTGRGAKRMRDEAITQAILMGAIVGVPFVIFGVVLGHWAIDILGAEAEVVRLGGVYLAIIFATSPARHVALIAARGLQGTGDTRTPMYVNIVSNGINIVLSVVLGLGLGPFPTLWIVGVGLATAFGNVFTACVLCLAIWSPYTRAGFRRPRDITIARQLFVVSLPKLGEGIVDTLVDFPFNALLLFFGTEVNAAYQIGRRMYQQVTGPLARGYNVGASIVVGQALGGGEPSTAKYNGWAAAALGILTVGTLGLALAAGADRLVVLFTRDPETMGYAIRFAQAYGITGPALVAFTVLAGGLQGGSETRTPLIARTTGLLLFYLGFSYVAGVMFGLGVPALYLGIILTYLWTAILVAAAFRWGGWVERATRMMDARRANAGGD